MNEERKIVSIVMPVKNNGALMLSSILSVINQEYKDWELNIIDDNSDENIKELISDYLEQDNRIKFTKLPSPFEGVADARNYGIEISNAKYIALLDADDIWHPRKLKFQLEFLENNNAEICCSTLVNFRSNEKIIFEKITDINMSSVSLEMTLNKYRTPTSSIVGCSKLFKEVKFKKNECNSFFCLREDLEWILNIHKKVLKIPKFNNTFLHYRIHDHQSSKKKINMMLSTFYTIYNHELSQGRKYGLKVIKNVVPIILLTFYFRLIINKLCDMPLDY